MTRERELLRRLIELYYVEGYGSRMHALMDEARALLAEPSEQAEVREEWGLVWPDLEGPFAGGVSTGYAEDTARAIARRENRTLVRREVSTTPWREVEQ